jgi:hypothetical protein
MKRDIVVNLLSQFGQLEDNEAFKRYYSAIDNGIAARVQQMKEFFLVEGANVTSIFD